VVNFASSELPMMNFGDGESQTVEFWPACQTRERFLPHKPAGFKRTNKASCEDSRPLYQ
jgi:hypothetical protein